MKNKPDPTLIYSETKLNKTFIDSLSQDELNTIIKKLQEFKDIKNKWLQNYLKKIGK